MQVLREGHNVLQGREGVATWPRRCCGDDGATVSAALPNDQAMSAVSSLML
jgi:hypothetical protein